MKGFFKTVAVVTVFSVSEKFLGFLYRIFMSRTVGAEGIGLYQVSLSVFALFLTVCCSGTPITVSRLITKYRAENDKKKERRVITAGLAITLVFSILICALFLIFKNSLGFLFADERCMKIFTILLPGLIFTSVYAVLRGVFWGNKDFLPYSVIELLEELCMIVVGIVLISISSTVTQGAYSAGIAVLISYIFSFTLATLVFFLRKNKFANPLPELKPLLSSAMPITAMRTTNSLAVSLVSVILPLRLVAAGFTNEGAMSAFGAAVGQAMPLLFIPTTLIGSFTLVLVPEIAEHYYKKNHDFLKRDIEKALKITVLVSCLFIPLFCVCGEEIGIIVFNSQECGKYLTVSSFLMLFMSLANITTSMLNSIGLETKTLVYTIISGIFMLLSIWFMPQFVGIYALLIGFSCVYGLITILNLILLDRQCPKKPEYKKFLINAVCFLIPTILFGFLLKNLVADYLGIYLTFILIGGIVTVFNAILYPVFGLVEIKGFKSKITAFLKKKKKRNRQPNF